MFKLNNTMKLIATTSAITLSCISNAQTLLEVGQMKVPLILVNYSDTTTTATASEIENKLFNSQYDVNDYFNEVSYGQFNVTGKAYGWFTMPESHDYYGENDPQNADWDKNYAQLALHAITQSDPSVDYSAYDADGDCIVDSVAVVYQGYDENDPLGQDTNVWPVNMSLDYENINGRTNDRCASDANRFVEVERITLIPELRSDNVDGLTPIGLLTHELVHSGFGNRLGDDWFPDLYGANGSEGISLWGLMGKGNHLGSIPYRTSDGEINPDYVTNDYTRPAHMTAFSKVIMNWVTPIELEAGDNMNQVQIKAASSSNPTVYKVAIPDDPKEYYLIENRYQNPNSFDAGIDASGLAIWHIDENSWANGTKHGCSFPDDPFVAASSGTCDQYSHSVIALAQADGSWEMEKGGSSDYEDLFSNSIAGISTSTYPSTRYYDFSESGLSITNISAPGEIMTADIKVDFSDNSLPTYCEAERPYTKGNGSSTLSIANAGSDQTVGFYWLNEAGERYPDFALRAPYAWITPNGSSYSADWDNGDKVVFVDQNDNCLTVADVETNGTNVEIKIDGGYANNIKIFDFENNQQPCESTNNCPVNGYQVPETNNTNWEHIDSVSIAGITNTTGNDNGYGDFSNNDIITIKEGDEITLSASGNAGENWIAWVDLNGDYEFSNNEIVYQSDTRANDVEGIISNLGSDTGLITRLRIAMSYGTPTSTGGFEGEIEDYTVLLGDAGACNNCSKEPLIEEYAVNVDANGYQHFSILVPANSSEISVELDKNGGSAMLMLREGSEATARTYDVRDSGGSHVNLVNPNAGTWFISIRGRTNGINNGNVTITVN
ncbi:M6 family metalloprotease domain-containing protein [Pseudoalteromonas sp. C2R02]|uniref:M6 family metalloprotease domain-containing protein n=1 Tax=Pseudoalteromonas sp. C2R02 TaxID=2841565 RepID=UPI001C087041|nr:M6 family metalloprotease domain-containing protein [Pseudoalteromonas sp. C2R02]MBU2970429.1 M6 family metalloprotease domain-containing protein [Pseudoalteromonas sp. C2R02]